MSGLVTYGSSDDEDEPPANHAEQSHDTAIPDSEHLANGFEPDLNNSQNLRAPIQGPMIGPTKPSEFNDGLDIDEDNHATAANHLQELDMLRLLTQPSHPTSSLPPEPDGQADVQVTAKFKKFLELKKKGTHFNEDLANRGSFNNPNLFASLLERIGVPPAAQYATTLPSDIFNLDLFPLWAYKEELSKSQQAFDKQIEIRKKSQSAARKRMIQFTTANADSSEEEKATPDLTSQRTRN